MSIELLIGAIIVIAFVIYFVVKDSKEPEAPVVEQKTEAEKPATVKKTTKKAAKVVTIDLNKQTKTELLAHAKAAGVKANASMKKADIIAAIKNG